MPVHGRYSRTCAPEVWTEVQRDLLIGVFCNAMQERALHKLLAV